MQVIRNLLLVATCCFAACHAYPRFQDEIPNGDAVPNTCAANAGDVWPGVGHLAIGGDGPRNLFGQAFNSAGQTWTVDLCNADSDKDGKTNGQELGDPNCEWTKGGTPSGKATGHPAICEPVTSEKCKAANDWVTECPAAEAGDKDSATPGGDTKSESGDKGASVAVAAGTAVIIAAVTVLMYM